MNFNKQYVRSLLVFITFKMIREGYFLLESSRGLASLISVNCYNVINSYKAKIYNFIYKLRTKVNFGLANTINTYLIKAKNSC